VAVAATTFLALSRAVSVAEGVPGLRIAEYPGTFSVDSASTMAQHFRGKTLGEIVEALTAPRAATPAPSPRANGFQRILTTSDLDRIGAQFFDQRLTDGLAITIPTVDRVEAFLRYTDVAPEAELAVLRPANRRATPLTIAANAVMAGCRPKHMPLLMAAVEAIADPYYDLEQIGTTVCLNPFLLVNGPIIKELGLEYGQALVSRGPNPAIGRAFGLILRNIAGFIPGEQYMGTFGYIMPFVVAEDESGSPWEPFQVSHGFDRGVSTVTAGGTHNWGFQAAPCGEDPEGLLKIIAAELVKKINLNIAGIMGKFSMALILITPNVAQAIARGGYSKQEAENYLFENARVHIDQISFECKYGNASGGPETIRSLKEKGWPLPDRWVELEGQDATVPAMPYPGMIDIVVCGDPNRNKAMVLYAVYTRPTTKQVTLLAARHR